MNKLILRLSLLTGPVYAFITAPVVFGRNRSVSVAMSSDGTVTPAVVSPSYLVEPRARDSHYGTNMAQYLVDLHDNKATFDFCGGMMFQLVLSDKLRDHLGKVAADTDANKLEHNKQQPKVFDATKMRMFRIPGYFESAQADNVQVFHGREIRNVPNANGGMGFVLHLSLATTSSNSNAKEEDREGWSPEEMAEYNGWMHDTGRKWRKALEWEKEGFTNVVEKFGPKSFGLHHRFYFHLDGQNRLWLSAEDGCEGTPAIPGAGGVAAFARYFGF